MVKKFVVHGELVRCAFLEIVNLGKEDSFSECGVGTKLFNLIDSLVDGGGGYLWCLVKSLHC